jgi:hypothetical protein
VAKVIQAQAMNAPDRIRDRASSTIEPPRRRALDGRIMNDTDERRQD